MNEMEAQFICGSLGILMQEPVKFSQGSEVKCTTAIFWLPRFLEILH